MVVLNESSVQAGSLIKGTSVEALEKKAAVITEHLGFQNQNFRKRGRDSFKIHC
jgi:hypothetical protein